MTQAQIIKKTADFVKKQTLGENTGHDWWHIYRVWQNAKKIGRQEKADMLVVELAALLHDIADYKFHGGDNTKGAKVASAWLTKIKADKNTIKHVADIIESITFKGAGIKDKIKTKEGQIVADADRIDTLGAIGIARTFATGAKLNRPIYDPRVKPTLHKSFKQYKKHQSDSINHFYEKLLLLKGRMNTKAGKKMAIERHQYMEKYLARFFKEWGGKL